MWPRRWRCWSGIAVCSTRPTIPAFVCFASTIWNTVAVNGPADRVIDSLAERHLGQIAELPRQAFLLLSVDAFSAEDAATILNVDLVETLGHRTIGVARTRSDAIGLA